MCTWFHGDAFGTTKNACFRAFISLRSQFRLHYCFQRTLTEIVSEITPNLGLVLQLFLFVIWTLLFLCFSELKLFTKAWSQHLVPRFATCCRSIHALPACLKPWRLGHHHQTLGASFCPKHLSHRWRMSHFLAVDVFQYCPNSWCHVHNTYCFFICLISEVFCLLCHVYSEHCVVKK